MSRSIPPDDRWAIVSQMRATLVQAKVGLTDLRDGLTAVRAKLAVEETKVETMRRRARLAANIGDTETVALAEQHEKALSERVAVLSRKVKAQEEELALAERDVAEMTAELRAAAGGGEMPGMNAPGAGAAAAAAAEVDSLTDSSGLAGELDAMSRARTKADREADADRKLEELKRRMGK